MTITRIALAFLVAITCTGCTQMTLKSPVKMLHDARLGNFGILDKEYAGSERAKEWHLREQAAQMQAQMNEPPTGTATVQ